MKKLSTFLFALLCSGLLHAQGANAKDEQLVQQTVQSMFDALSKRDSVRLKDLCSTDILLFEYGSIWNLDTLILKAIIQNQANDFSRTNSFDFINTEVEKNAAWVSYRLHSEITRNGKKGSTLWLETVVLVRDKQSWKIKILHSTLLKRT